MLIERSSPAAQVLSPDVPQVTASEFHRDVLSGLSSQPKTLPCKYLYDAAGARLFEEICRLPEYYLTRTELGILRRHADQIAELIGPECLLMEYGSGASEKTRILLDHLERPAAYIPIDLAREQLAMTAAALSRDYPGLDVRPLAADFSQPYELPSGIGANFRRIVFFPGSTIGNFSASQAAQLFAEIARICGPGGGLLLGADLRKDPRIIEAAYNDAQGVTAAFNLNLLARINRELGADFRPSQFAHRALYDPAAARVEMQLVSRCQQQVRLGSRTIGFRPGESIRTEHSHKYSLAELRALGLAVGMQLTNLWTDPRQYFCVAFFSISD